MFGQHLMVRKLIQLWDKDSRLAAGVPYRRMAGEAVDFIFNNIMDTIEPVLSDADLHECYWQLDMPCYCEDCQGQYWRGKKISTESTKGDSSNEDS